MSDRPALGIAPYDTLPLSGTADEPGFGLVPETRKHDAAGWWAPAVDWWAFANVDGVTRVEVRATPDSADDPGMRVVGGWHARLGNPAANNLVLDGLPASNQNDSQWGVSHEVASGWLNCQRGPVAESCWLMRSWLELADDWPRIREAPARMQRIRDRLEALVARGVALPPHLERLR